MGLRDHIRSGTGQIHAFCAREELFASVSGRSFRVAVSSIDKSKAVEVDGFMTQESAPFIVRKDALNGHTVDSLQGQILTFETRFYRIIQVIDNGLSFTLRCVAKDQGK